MNMLATRCNRLVCGFILLAGLPPSLLSGTEAEVPQYPEPERYEGAIRAFEAQETLQEPPKGAVLCIGSSSMRMWHPAIREDLAPLTVIPRGFGGSNMNDVLYFMDRIVFPYRPRAIVLYEGDNDTAMGIPNDVILGKFIEFFARVHESLPRCRIYVVATKPSVSRVKFLPAVQELNDSLEGLCSADPLMTFLDVETPMLGGDGEPLPDIFLDDGVHMKREGYEIWRDVIRPVLLENELKHEARVLLHADFDGDLSSGLAKALLDHPLIELAEGGGLDGTDGIRVSYVGYDKGSKRVVVRYPLAGHVEKATLQFDVCFDKDFQWTHGGKLHGLGPEQPITGGKERFPYGWSARTMFKDGGNISTYLYDQDKTKKWGVGKSTEVPVFTAGTWHRVELEIRLNDPGEPNGYARVKIDGEEVLLSVGVVLRGEPGRHTLISQLLFSTFHGGNTTWWTPVDEAGNPTTVYASFDNFIVHTE